MLSKVQISWFLKSRHYWISKNGTFNFNFFKKILYPHSWNSTTEIAIIGIQFFRKLIDYFRIPLNNIRHLLNGSKTVKWSPSALNESDPHFSIRENSERFAKMYKTPCNGNMQNLKILINFWQVSRSSDSLHWCQLNE